VPRRNQESLVDETLELLKIAPIWVGPVLALSAFVLVRYGLTWLMPGPAEGPVDAGWLLRSMMPMLAWFAAGIVMLAWAAAELWKLTNRRLLDRQTGLDSIRDVSWQKFELLVGEAYRRKGYLAELVGSASGDGGGDIELHGHGQKVLLQCKQWRAYKVGVKVVRELLGVVVSRKADKGIIVTSGRFTEEANRFARQNPQIELVDGSDLAELIRTVQVEDGGKQVKPATAVARPSVPPRCPSCGANMVLRTARRGQHAGSQFWGCATYPACDGKRSLSQ
jgi:restriction system protein